MRKLLTSGTLAAALALTQAAPALAHSTNAEVSSDNGVVVSYDHETDSDDDGLLEDILGDFNDNDSDSDDDGLLEDILGDYNDNDSDSDDSDGVLGIFDDEDSDSSDSVLGDIL